MRYFEQRIPAQRKPFLFIENGFLFVKVTYPGDAVSSPLMPICATPAVYPPYFPLNCIRILIGCGKYPPPVSGLPVSVARLQPVLP